MRRIFNITTLIVICSSTPYAFKLQNKSIRPIKYIGKHSNFQQGSSSNLHNLPVDKDVQTEINVSKSSLIATATTTSPTSIIGEKEKELSVQTYTLLTLLFLVTAICSLDRVAMSVAIIPMGLELGYNEEIKGTVSTMFSFGYLFGMIPAGILGSFISPKYVLGTGVLLWSIAQSLSPFAAKYSLGALFFSRFCMGLSEAVTVPTVQNFVSRYVPEKSKSVVLGIVLSGLQVGNVGAFLVSPYLLDNYGWASVLIAYGLVGLLWLALWIPFAPSPTLPPNNTTQQNIDIKRLSSSSSSSLSSSSSSTTSTSLTNKKTTLVENTNYINNEDNKESNDSFSITTLQVKWDDFKHSISDVPFTQMIQSKEIQSIAVAHAVQNFGLYINLAWLPTFFYQRYGLSVDDSSFSSVLPWVAGAIAGPFTGFLADKCISNGIEKTLVRKIAQTFALIVPAYSLLSLSMASNDLTSESAIAYFILAVASAACCVAGFGASVQDVCKSSKYVSIVYSLTSAPAVLMGSVGVYLTGVILDNTHSFSLVFQGTSLVYLIGAIFYALNYEAKKIIE